MGKPYELKPEYEKAGVKFYPATEDYIDEASGRLVQKPLGYDVLIIPHKMNAELKQKAKNELMGSRKRLKVNIHTAGFTVYDLGK